jgi:DNA-binding response OmpR family regulator
MSKKTILLTEDDPFLIDIYTTKLGEDFDVKVARNGKEALKMVKEKTPDLLLLDIVLPQIDGWQVLAEIRKEKKLEKIPVVVLSNLGQKTEIDKGFNLGVAKYLIKAHFTPAEVVEEIKKIIK